MGREYEYECRLSRGSHYDEDLRVFRARLKNARKSENTPQSGPRKLVMGSDSYIHNKGKEDG